MPICSRTVPKATSEGVEEVPIGHYTAPDDEAKHDYEHEIYCWCYPTVNAYYGENGQIDYMTVDHKRVQ